MGNEIAIRKTQSIWKELDKMQESLMKRAFEIFDGNGGIFGTDLENWLAAERELVWKPQIEMKEEDHAFNIKIAVPGVDPKDLDIEVTPEVLLVKAETRHEHKESKGEVHTCEFQSGNLFRSIRFPKEIDPDKVKAEFKNGMLRIRAGIHESAHGKKVTVDAA